MGFLKDVHSNKDIQAFPGARFEIVGDVPAPQCSEAKIEGIAEILLDSELTDPGKFVGWNLVGKYCTITASVPDKTGTHFIAGNSDHIVFLFPEPGNAVDVHYYIHNGGSLILTRDVPSFAAFIHAAGYAYTIKAGKLYTNIPSQQLQPACSILFNPLT